MPCLHNFTIMSQTLAWSPVTGAITTQPTGWITVWPAWLFICCWDNSPAEQRGAHFYRKSVNTDHHPNTHTHRQNMVNSISDDYAQHMLLLSTFPHPPTIMYYYNPPPNVLHHILSPSIMHLLPTSYPIPSHPIPSYPSPCLPAWPGRLQMVLNGRITERNCFVNNSTGTRWATGQPACVDTEEWCTHATHTCIRYQVK